MNNVDICNMALANLGQDSIMALDNLPGRTSAAQKACKLRYDEARRECIAAAPWNFATTWRVGIEVSGMTPKAPWSKVFRYPVDALRVFDIQKLYPGEKDTPFEVLDAPDNSGKVILTDHPNPTFVYVRDKTNVDTWDENFKNSVAWLLAAKIAMPITKSDKKRNDAYQMYLSTIDVAVTRDENEGTEQTDTLATYQEAR
jgi:hypothetical protein